MCDITSCCLLQVVGGLDIHKTMVVDIWRPLVYSSSIHRRSHSAVPPSPLARLFVLTIVRIYFSELTFLPLMVQQSEVPTAHRQVNSGEKFLSLRGGTGPLNTLSRFTRERWPSLTVTCALMISWRNIVGGPCISSSSSPEQSNQILELLIFLTQKYKKLNLIVHFSNCLNE